MSLMCESWGGSELVRVGDRVWVCAGEGLPRLHYAWGRLHAVIVCVWCGSMRAHCCAVRPNRELL